MYVSKTSQFSHSALWAILIRKDALVNVNAGKPIPLVGRPVSSPPAIKGGSPVNKGPFFLNGTNLSTFVQSSYSRLRNESPCANKNLFYKTENRFISTESFLPHHSVGMSRKKWGEGVHQWAAYYKYPRPWAKCYA